MFGVIVCCMRRCFASAISVVSVSVMLLGAPGIATSSKDAIRGSWPYY